jgi:hypothetical protein
VTYEQTDKSLSVTLAVIMQRIYLFLSLYTDAISTVYVIERRNWDDSV